MWSWTTEEQIRGSLRDGFLIQMSDRAGDVEMSANLTLNEENTNEMQTICR